jgi:predicted metal-binding transcription factor (methanogenesis marker protein 9)
VLVMMVMVVVVVQENIWLSCNVLLQLLAQLYKYHSVNTTMVKHLDTSSHGDKGVVKSITKTHHQKEQDVLALAAAVAAGDSSSSGQSSTSVSGVVGGEVAALVSELGDLLAVSHVSPQGRAYVNWGDRRGCGEDYADDSMDLDAYKAWSDQWSDDEWVEWRKQRAAKLLWKQQWSEETWAGGRALPAAEPQQQLEAWAEHCAWGDQWSDDEWVEWRKQRAATLLWKQQWSEEAWAEHCAWSHQWSDDEWVEWRKQRAATLLWKQQWSEEEWAVWDWQALQEANPAG